jgi:glycine hydroxymethyltransferase
LNLVFLPYDRRRGIIDIDEVRKLVAWQPPKLVFLDASMQLFPHPLTDLRDAIGDDPIISYDASHTMGLIAGGAFQSPLREGADLLHGSTHKTLWGPQKGLITVRDEGPIAQRIRDAVVPFFVSNVHVHHVAALGVALEEALEYGPGYAQAVVRNAKTLAAALHGHGVAVPFAERGHTDSHQVLIELGDKSRSLEIWNRLQNAGINTNAISLPFRQSHGLRIGVAEATRRGLGVNEMDALAEWIALCIANPGQIRHVARKVEALCEHFSRICYARSASSVDGCLPDAA